MNPYYTQTPLVNNQGKYSSTGPGTGDIEMKAPPQKYARGAPSNDPLFSKFSSLSSDIPSNLLGQPHQTTSDDSILLTPAIRRRQLNPESSLHTPPSLRRNHSLGDLQDKTLQHNPSASYHRKHPDDLTDFGSDISGHLLHTGAKEKTPERPPLSSPTTFSHLKKDQGSSGRDLTPGDRSPPSSPLIVEDPSRDYLLMTTDESPTNLGPRNLSPTLRAAKIYGRSASSIQRPGTPMPQRQANDFDPLLKLPQGQYPRHQAPQRARRKREQNDFQHPGASLTTDIDSRDARDSQHPGSFRSQGSPTRLRNFPKAASLPPSSSGDGVNSGFFVTEDPTLTVPPKQPIGSPPAVVHESPTFVAFSDTSSFDGAGPLDDEGSSFSTPYIVAALAAGTAFFGLLGYGISRAYSYAFPWEEKNVIPLSVDPTAKSPTETHSASGITSPESRSGNIELASLPKTSSEIPLNLSSPTFDHTAFSTNLDEHSRLNPLSQTNNLSGSPEIETSSPTTFHDTSGTFPSHLAETVEKVAQNTLQSSQASTEMPSLLKIVGSVALLAGLAYGATLALDSFYPKTKTPSSSNELPEIEGPALSQEIAPLSLPNQEKMKISPKPSFLGHLSSAVQSMKKQLVEFFSRLFSFSKFFQLKKSL